MTISTSHSKTKEVEGFIKSTFDPLKGYLTEAEKIGARVKGSMKKKEEYMKLKESINIAVLDVLEEVNRSKKNGKLAKLLDQKKEETEQLKKAAKEKMNDLKAATTPATTS